VSKPAWLSERVEGQPYITYEECKYPKEFCPLFLDPPRPHTHHMVINDLKITCLMPSKHSRLIDLKDPSE
jgi:hypothetical protein